MVVTLIDPERGNEEGPEEQSEIDERPPCEDSSSLVRAEVNIGLNYW